MVSKLEELKKYAGGSEVELPGFVSDEPFVVKLKRPSLLEMAESGTISNPLLGTAAELFRDGVTKPINSGEKFKDMAQVLHCIAEAALVEPSYQELKEAGIQLTDFQLLHIYDYVQTGVNALKLFREKQGANASNESGTGAENKRQPGAKNRR
ncbi:esterase [Lacrimispora sp. NSJ-141]|uniref:Esterase n=1 Tax=Lientehia hominis TaxID=2897778 RepID=A0AAP2W908_9FIRM|nr:esterase [Lientehia hominis]MCD2492731.1 esterase [Lientehia hominis]